MNFLEKLTPEHRQTVIRLPYRVGLWISCSDSGGAEAEASERQALSNILHAFAEELFGSENIQYIMSATIREKNSWPEWGRDLDLVLDDCRVALDLLREHGDAKDTNALKNHLMEIAEAVALAFREDQNLSIFSTAAQYIRYTFSSSKKSRVRSFDEFLNISPGERKALAALADVLEAA